MHLLTSDVSTPRCTVSSARFLWKWAHHVNTCRPLPPMMLYHALCTYSSRTRKQIFRSDFFPCIMYECTGEVQEPRTCTAGTRNQQRRFTSQGTIHTGQVGFDNKTSFDSLAFPPGEGDKVTRKRRQKQHTSKNSIWRNLLIRRGWNHINNLYRCYRQKETLQTNDSESLNGHL